MPIREGSYAGRPHFWCDTCGADSATKAVLEAHTCSPADSSATPAKATRPRPKRKAPQGSKEKNR